MGHSGNWAAKNLTSQVYSGNSILELTSIWVTSRRFLAGDFFVNTACAVWLYYGLRITDLAAA
jgi:hypothetical protein